MPFQAHKFSIDSRDLSIVYHVRNFFCLLNVLPQVITDFDTRMHKNASLLKYSKVSEVQIYAFLLAESLGSYDYLTILRNRLSIDNI